MSMWLLKGKDGKERERREFHWRNSSFQDFGQYLLKKIREFNGDSTVREVLEGIE